MALPIKSGAGHGRFTVCFSDSLDLIEDQVHLCPKGVSLMTKWQLREGTEVEFAFDHGGARHCCLGVVVACHPLRRPIGCYSTLIYFVEVPCEQLQQAASDCRLARQGRRPRHEKACLDTVPRPTWTNRGVQPV